MLIQIEKDASTRLSKEVETIDDAKSFAERGFHVSIAQEDGSFKPLTDVLADQAPVEEEADAKAKAKAKK